MGRPTVDDSGWPILVATYAESMTSDEAEGFYQDLARHLHRGERFAAPLDARLAEVPRATDRARIVAFLKETVAPQAGRVAGVALVMQSAAGRGVLTAVLWLYAPPFPMCAFTSMDEGRAWLRERLSASPPAT